MNLINDPWIPIRRKSGKLQLIAPWQLTEAEDPIIALDAPRQDFNGDLMQFLIGLLQTTTTPASHDVWLDWLEEPPAPEELKECFTPYIHAFELQSEKGSFMQDFEPLDGRPNSIAGILIDSPGDKTIKENKDHFIKRGHVTQLCPCCVATALFSLQTNAPAGGQGNRTSLRGGGPLTTLVILDESSDLVNDLWRNLWLNVMAQQQLESLTGDKDKADQQDIFPWLANTRTSEKNTGMDTTPVDVNPLQMYWGMPRRIRIQWDSCATGHCHLCDTLSNKLVTHYQTRNYGVNYTGAWQHPLSPYSLNKTGDLLPQHAQPGGMTYQHWLTLIEDSESQFSAIVVKRYLKLSNEWGEQIRIYAFGYDMDKMKARCWYETTFPFFTLAENIRLNFAKRVQSMTVAASEFAGLVRTCVKEAWFKRAGDAKGDTSFLMQNFYHHTESAFYQTVKSLQVKLLDGTDKEVLHSWHVIMRKAALNLFDYWATQGDFSQANPRRITDARTKLKKLMYSKKIKEALQLSSKPKKEAA